MGDFGGTRMQTIGTAMADVKSTGGPIREGNRGGAGLFKWTDVAQDKDREVR